MAFDILQKDKDLAASLNKQNQEYNNKIIKHALEGCDKFINMFEEKFKKEQEAQTKQSKEIIEITTMAENLPKEDKLNTKNEEIPEEEKIKQSFNTGV